MTATDALKSGVVSSKTGPALSAEVQCTHSRASVLQLCMSTYPFSSGTVAVATTPDYFASQTYTVGASSPSFGRVRLAVRFPYARFDPTHVASRLRRSVVVNAQTVSNSRTAEFEGMIVSYTTSDGPSSVFASVAGTPSSAYLQTVSGTSSCFFSLVDHGGLHRPTALRHSPALAGLVSKRASDGSGPSGRGYTYFFANAQNYAPYVGS